MMKPTIKQTIFSAAVVVIAVLVVYFSKSAQVNRKLSPEKNIEAAKIKGNSSSLIRLVEFSDFQCPSCAFSQTSIQKLFENYPNILSLEFRHFPLPMHPWAYEAAKFAECSAEQGKFWGYHDLLFQEQKKWSEDPDPLTLFYAFGNQLKLDTQKLRECLMGDAVKMRIEKDVALGKSAQVNSTPTFFVGEVRMVGGKQLEEKVPELIKANRAYRVQRNDQ